MAVVQQGLDLPPMLARHDLTMSDDEQRDSIEESLRAMAQNIGDSFKRLVGDDFDFDDVVRATGVDPDEAKRWAHEAGEWLNAQSGRFHHEPGGPKRPAEASLRGADPHPLDLPTEEQGLALAALDSGRWTIEPGTSMLVSHGEGPAPKNALGLVRELRVRDWIDAEGTVASAGRRALDRWLA
jgi:hypothetical protein